VVQVGLQDFINKLVPTESVFNVENDKSEPVLAGVLSLYIL
jgi:hypothetical protein